MLRLASGLALGTVIAALQVLAEIVRAFEVARAAHRALTAEDADLVARMWRTLGRVSTAVDDRPPFR